MPDKSVKETKTTIDSMLELLRSRGKMDINSVSAALNVAPSVIEGWAKIFETGGLARITYDFGRMFIEPIELQGVSQEVLKAQTGAKKTVIEQSVETQNVLISRITDAIKSIDQATLEAEKEFATKEPELRKSLDELNKLKNIVEVYKVQMQEVARGVDTDYNTLIKKIETVNRGLAPFTAAGFETTIHTITRRINEIIDAIKNTEGAISAIQKSKDSTVSDIRKNLAAQVKILEDTTNKSIGKVNESFGQYKAQLDEQIRVLDAQAALGIIALKQLRELNSEEQIYTKRIEDHKRALTEKYEKVQSEIRATNVLMARKSEELTTTVNNLIKKFGPVGQVSNSINIAKAKKSDIEKEISSMLVELKEINDVLASIGSSKAMSDEQRSKLISGLEQKSSQTMVRIEGLRKSLSSINTELKGSA